MALRGAEPGDEPPCRRIALFNGIWPILVVRVTTGGSSPRPMPISAGADPSNLPLALNTEILAPSLSTTMNGKDLLSPEVVTRSSVATASDRVSDSPEGLFAVSGLETETASWTARPSEGFGLRGTGEQRSEKSRANADQHEQSSRP